MALFSQAPKVSKGGQPEETQDKLDSSYTIIKDQKAKLYETPPATTRSNSIGSALSRLVKRGISRGKSPTEMGEILQRPKSADSPLSPQDKIPKKQIPRHGARTRTSSRSRITWNPDIRSTRTQDNLVTPNLDQSKAEPEVDGRRRSQTHRGGGASYAMPLQQAM